MRMASSCACTVPAVVMARSTPSPPVSFMTVSTRSSSSVAMNRASGRNCRAMSSRARERWAAKTREAPNTLESSSIMHPMGPSPMMQMLFPRPNRASSSPFIGARQRLRDCRLGKGQPVGDGVTGP